MLFKIEVGPDLSAKLHIDMGIYCAVASKLREREWLLRRISLDQKLDDLDLKGRRAIILCGDKLYWIKKDASPPQEIHETDENRDSYQKIKLGCGRVFELAEKEELASIRILTGDNESIDDPIPDSINEALIEHHQHSDPGPSVKISYKDCFFMLRQKLVECMRGLAGELAWHDLKKGLMDRCNTLKSIQGPKQEEYTNIAMALEHRADDGPLCLQILDRSFVELMKNSIDSLIMNKIIHPEAHGKDTVDIQVTFEWHNDAMIIKISDDAGGFPDDYIAKFNRRLKDSFYKIFEHASDSIKKGPDKKFYCGGCGIGLEEIRESIEEMSIENGKMGDKRGALIILKSSCRGYKLEVSSTHSVKKGTPDSGLDISMISDHPSPILVDEGPQKCNLSSSKEGDIFQNRLFERRKKRSQSYPMNQESKKFLK